MLKQKTDIALLGAAFHTGNMGVGALAASTLKIVSMIEPDAEISFFIPHNTNEIQRAVINGKEKNIGVINYRMSPASKPGENIFIIFLISLLCRLLPAKSFRGKILSSNTFLKKLLQTDIFLDIHGGDSFSDIYGMFNFITDSLPRIIIVMLNRKYILLPQTYGPFKSHISRLVASYILRGAELIFSRDQESIGVVNNLIKKKGPLKNIIFCPDVAFMLDPVKPNAINIKPVLDLSDNRKYNLIGLNISGLLYKKVIKKGTMAVMNLNFDYERFIDSLIKKIITETDSHIILCPHTFGVYESDYIACRTAREAAPPEYRDRIHMAEGEYNQNEMKAIIGLNNFFIGSRMHSCIAALSQGIPAIGVSYSRKFAGVFNTVGMADYVIDARSETADSAINTILKIYKQSDCKNKNENLVQKVKQTQGSILNHFKEIFISGKR